jgi:soluble lytic murein transglycosylase
VALVAASYNAGPHRVQGWIKEFGQLDMDEFIEHIPYMETRNYVKKVIRNFFVYQTLYEKKANQHLGLADKLVVKYSGPKPSSENWDE